MAITGFNAYIFYIRTKVHFNSKKYNIIDNKIDKDKYIRPWNKKRADRDGLLFQSIEKYLPRNRMKFIRCFAYYYLQNPNFYLTDILESKFKLYKYNEFQFNCVKEVVISDFRYILYFADKNKRSLKDVFRNKKHLPAVFRLYEKKKISIFGLLVFEKMFNISEHINFEKLDFLEKEKYIFYVEKVFDKFEKIVHNGIFEIGIDWKDVIRNLYKG